MTGGFWRAVSCSPGFTIAFFIFTWINHHVDETALVFLPISILLAIPFNILVANNKFCRAVFFLVFFELVMRLFRMYFVQLTLFISPVSFLEENVKLFVDSYACTSNTAIDLSRNASAQVTRQAVSVASSLLSSINTVTSQIQDVVSPTINLLDEVLNSTIGIFQTVSSIDEQCRSELAALESECQQYTLDMMTCKNKYGPVLSIVSCAFMPHASAACNALQSGEICNVLMSGDLSTGLVAAQNAIKSLNKELIFDLELDFSSNITTNNFFNEIQKDIKKDMNDSLGMVSCWYQSFGYLFGCTIFYLVYKKARVVWNFRNTGLLVSEKVSKFMLYTNPFIFQGIFICLNLFSDCLIRIFYEMHKKQLKQKPL